MKVLVTGSAGFVGGWLLEHLAAAGDDVVELPVDLDVRDLDALTGAVVDADADAVCHLAAQASVGASWDDPDTTFDVNAKGTLHLCRAALAARRPPRVLVVSSAEVYGNVGSDSLPIRESVPFAPVSPYAASKAAAELIGVQYALGRGLEVVRARPFNHTGPGQRPDFVVPSLARQVATAVRAGLPALEVGNLEVRRDLTDVRDVVRAYRLLLVDGAPGAVYNVCRGTSVRIADVAARLLRLAGVELPVVVDPARVRPADLPELRGDPAALVAATGWQPAIDLDTSLRDVLDFWSRSEDVPTA